MQRPLGPRVQRVLEFLDRGVLLVDLASGNVTELGKPLSSRDEAVAAAYGAESAEAALASDSGRVVLVGERFLVARAAGQCALVADVGQVPEWRKTTLAELLAEASLLVETGMRRYAQQMASEEAAFFPPRRGGTPPTGAPAEARVVAPGPRRRPPS